MHMLLELSVPIVSILAYLFLIFFLLVKRELYLQRPQNKRFDLRAEITWPATLQAAEKRVEGQTKNLSAAGALVACPQPLSPGESVQMTLKPPDRLVEVIAEVMRANICQPADQGKPHYEIALRFKEIAPDNKAFIFSAAYERLLSHRH